MKNKVILTLLIIVIILLMGIIGFGGYKYMEMDKKYNDVNKKLEDAKEELANESKSADKNAQYKFDLSELKCIKANNKSCEKTLEVRYNGQNHSLKIVSFKEKKDKEIVMIKHQVYIDEKEFFIIDGGEYSTILWPSMEKENLDFSGYVYIFDGKYLGFVLPSYAGEKLGYETTVLTPEGELIKTITAQMAYTSFGTDELGGLDLIEKIEFDGHTMKMWDLNCKDLTKAKQIGITIEDNKMVFKELKEISDVMAGGQGGCKLQKEVILK